jgi:carboxyl-terminal processing protease
MKTVVLVNNGSASASEITALALRDYRQAQLVGEQTYGKGVVQQLLPFSDGSSLKVTIAKWYSPKGTNIDQKGIKPDQLVKPTDDDITNKNDVQLQTAQTYLAQ